MQLLAAHWDDERRLHGSLKCMGDLHIYIYIYIYILYKNV